MVSSIGLVSSDPCLQLFPKSEHGEEVERLSRQKEASTRGEPALPQCTQELTGVLGTPATKLTMPAAFWSSSSPFIVLCFFVIRGGGGWLGFVGGEGGLV